MHTHTHRNGTGKSTLLKAIAERLIPGLPPSPDAMTGSGAGMGMGMGGGAGGMRILLLDQVQDTIRTEAGKGQGRDDGKEESVLDHVVRGDVARTKALKRYEGA